MVIWELDTFAAFYKIISPDVGRIVVRPTIIRGARKKNNTKELFDQERVNIPRKTNRWYFTVSSWDMRDCLLVMNLARPIYTNKCLQGVKHLGISHHMETNCNIWETAAYLLPNESDLLCQTRKNIYCDTHFIETLVKVLISLNEYSLFGQITITASKYNLQFPRLPNYVDNFVQYSLSKRPFRSLSFAHLIRKTRKPFFRKSL